MTSMSLRLVVITLTGIVIWLLYTYSFIQLVCPTPPTCRIGENSQRALVRAEIMEGYTGEKVDPADPKLIERIRHHFIDLPRPFVTKFSMKYVETPQAKEVSRIFNNKMQFKEHAIGQGRLVTDSQTDIKQPSLILNTYCFPLYSLMLALNCTRIDYFSLDVEGLELPILKSIPYDKLDIAVITAEFKHGESQEEYINFMASKRYKMVKKLIFEIKEIYLGGRDFVIVREDLI